MTALKDHLAVSDRSVVLATPKPTVRSGVTATNTPPECRDATIPFAIPRSQLYYWTARWQDDEREALAELARGEGREFKSAADAIRWLLDPEDE